MKFQSLAALVILLTLLAPAAADPLHDAARNGDTKAIARLLAAGAVVYVQDAYGNTPLHRAVDNGQLAAIAALRGAGADVNARNKEGFTPIQLALRNGDEAAAAALRRNIASISTIQSGIYTDSTCSNPSFLWIYVPDVTINIDRSSESDSVSIGYLKPDSAQLVHGWQRFRFEYSNREPFGLFLRMATTGSVQATSWDPEPEGAREPPRSAWTEVLPATGAEAGEHWQLTTYEKCDTIPFPLSMLHGEPAAFLLSLGPAIEYCRNGHPACVQKIFAAADIHHDGALSTAEWARVVRVAIYFAMALDDEVKTETLGTAYAFGLLAVPLAASALVTSYDYDGDRKTSLAELLHAIAQRDTTSILTVEGVDPDIRERLGEAITILRGLSRNLPGMP